jgi:hypothetical protein
MAGVVEAVPTTVYGVGSSNLYEITDFTSWATTLIGPTQVGGTDVVLTGLAMDNAGTALYGIDLGESGPSSELYSINPTNGNTTAIGSTGIDGLKGLVLSSGGILYATDFANGNIYTIDTSTGAATLLGANSGFASAGGLGFANGTLYLTGFSTGNDYLYSVNTSTGAATQVDPGNGICTGAADTPTCYTKVGSLAFVNGTLEGFSGSFVLNLDTSTGLVTGSHAYSPGFNGATVFSGTPDPVPEPGVLGTSLLGLVAGAWVLRKRRASERR